MGLKPSKAIKIKNKQFYKTLLNYWERLSMQQYQIISQILFQKILNNWEQLLNK
jgi:hypothetical protein